jgi:hypothetical protein
VLLASSEYTQCAVNVCYRSGEIDRMTGQLGYTFDYDATSDAIAARIGRGGGRIDDYAAASRRAGPCAQPRKKGRNDRAGRI